MVKTEKKKILWVEDDFFHLKGLIRPLLREGFQVLNAKSFEEAIEILNKETNLCLIILDLIIPYSVVGNLPPKYREEEHHEKIETTDDLVENGVNLFYYIKNDLKLVLPIIILSVVQNQSVVDKLMENGAAKKVQKLGFLPPELKKSVLELLKNELK